MISAQAARAADGTAVAQATGQATAQAAAQDLRAASQDLRTAAQDLRAAEAVTAEALEMGIEPSEYWLGVVIGPPTPETREKLKLPKDQGLLVETVEPKSPAEKAGLKPHDVVLKANDKPLSDLRDMLKLINEVKEGKLTLDVLRDGKHETIVVNPAKRSSGDLAEARKWIEQLRPRMKAGQLGYTVVGPGQIVPFAAAGQPSTGQTNVEVTVHTKASLPDGWQVEITRHGGDPAKVVVTHEKERFEGTSKDLKNIPEKVRADVERLLNAPMGRIILSPAGGGAQYVAPDNMMYFSGPAPRSNEMPGMIAVGPNVEKRLGEMQKQIDELRKQMDALQGAKAKKE
jgi:hypothetical protein